jgi:hypothetical protein
MRAAIYVALFVACAAAAPVQTRAVLESAASVLFETLPYVAGAALLRPMLGRFAPAALAFAGCGCGRGPGARSIPAAIAAAALFGPAVAGARFVGACVIARLRSYDDEHDDASILADVTALALPALLCGILVSVAPLVDLSHQRSIVQLALGATLGFTAAPCALGGVALAAALRTQSPLASAAALAITGIVDMRVWWRAGHKHATPDRVAYALLAVACVVVAYRHGATLVHPRMTLPLWGSAIFFAILAARTPVLAAPTQRAIAAALISAAILGSTPPPATATATTLDDAYPGERVDFTGTYDSSGVPRVVRYAITCCRADARPVTLRLARRINYDSGAWLHVSGSLSQTARGDLVLEPASVTRVATPVDPFVYL